MVHAHRPSGRMAAGGWGEAAEAAEKHTRTRSRPDTKSG